VDDSQDYAKRVLSLGANNYVTKPVRIEQLKELLEEYNECVRDDARRDEMSKLIP
jgi:YesN/AraC family two-component response regulator